MSHFILKAAPDYLALSAKDFLRHVNNLYTTDTYPLFLRNPAYTKILGYACRSLFETTLKILCQNEIVLATTPLNHTSFRNIIENNVKPENLHIIDIKPEMNGIRAMPKVEKCDVVVITHMFGQDFDIADLEQFKARHNCLVLEDRVQGGTLTRPFSNDCIDLAFYSMAMDKRPIALGGGYLHIRNQHQDLIKQIVTNIQKLPVEPHKERMKEFIKKIPTFLLYNSRFFLFLFVNVVNYLNRLNPEINILNITKSYRKSNPGFSHNRYMKKPSAGLIKSMHENLTDYQRMENLYSTKSRSFMLCFSERLQHYFFPWYRNEAILTPYNTISIEPALVEQFLQYMNQFSISVIANPTYKLFNHSYDQLSSHEKLNNSIVYLPSVANMTRKEMDYLSNRIKQFYLKYCVPRMHQLETMAPTLNHSLN